MTTENTVLIFHRSKQNIEESLANQQAFLENYSKNFTSPVKVIDYMSGNYSQARELTEMISKYSSSRLIVIINSALSQEEYLSHYDMYSFLKFLKIIDKASLYLMDSEGKLYKEIKNIKDIGEQS